MKMKNAIKKPFVGIPRFLRDDFFATGKINYSEFSIVHLLCHISNPINGKAIISYEQLATETKISSVYLRKMFSNLVFHNLIWFKPHRGRGGTFPVWVNGFIRSNKTMNNIDEIKIKELNSNLQTSNSPSNSQVSDQVCNHFHNLNNGLNQINTTKKNHTDSPIITTSNNDNYNDNKNNLIEKNQKGLKMLRETVNRLNKKMSF